MTRRYGFHFASLISIIFFMLWGFSPTLSVFWSTVLTFALSFLTQRDRAQPKKLVRALSDGSTSALTAATTCATAGIIVGVVTLTGLGLKFSAIVDRLCRRQPAAHRALHRADRLDRRPRGAGDGVLHHLRGGRRARLDQARRARHRGAHVHLLLLGALRGLAADRALAVRRRRDHRRRSLQDDLAGVEVHAAGVPRAVRVRARSAGRRAAADAPEGRLVGRYRADHPEGRARPCGARRRRAGLGAAPHDHGGARPARARGPVPRVPEPARGADRADYRARHQLYRDNWLGHRGRSS